MKKRIPTLFGLTLLLIALILLLIIYYYQEQLTLKKKGLLSPKRVELVNLTEDSATITWQTDFFAKGSVIYGQQTPTQKERDYRDRQKRQNRISHYVTLQNLQPQTRYYYKIRVGDYTYPDTPLQFTTGPDLEDQLFDQSNSANQPLRGTVVDEEFKPVDEALVFLKIPGASKLATFVSTAGNFIIPLDLRAEDLKSRFVIKDKTDATIEILRGNSQSLIEITLPLEDQSLSYLQLGRNINLKQFLVGSKQPPQVKFDLNGDNKVNSLDLSVVLQNFGKNPKIKEVDFNLDGVVDQKDFDLIKQAIR